MPFVSMEVVSIFHNDAHELSCTNGVVIADIMGDRVVEVIREVDDIVHVEADWLTP